MIKKLIFVLLGFFYNSYAVAVLQPDDIFKTYQHPRFRKFKTVTAPNLESFVKQNLGLLEHKTNAVFYPFGGPDIIYPLMLFPQAQSYLLIGLEPRGVEDISFQMPKNLNDQLDSLLRRSFFVTSDMSRIISYKQGLIPLFLAQIALMGGVVQNINYQDYPFGKLLEITFMHLESEKKLLYIQTNVTNQSLSDDLFKFINDNNLFDTCMIKASSYSFHKTNFSKLMDFVTTNAKVILQDDTGIPLKELSKYFSIRLFGNYIKPYGKEWAGYFQKDLYEMYHETIPKSDIRFCYGYGCGRSPVTIMLAIRPVE